MLRPSWRRLTLLHFWTSAILASFMACLRLHSLVSSWRNRDRPKSVLMDRKWHKNLKAEGNHHHRQGRFQTQGSRELVKLFHYSIFPNGFPTILMGNLHKLIPNQSQRFRCLRFQGLPDFNDERILLPSVQAAIGVYSTLHDNHGKSNSNNSNNNNSND